MDNYILNVECKTIFNIFKCIHDDYGHCERIINDTPERILFYGSLVFDEPISDKIKEDDIKLLYDFTSGSVTGYINNIAESLPETCFLVMPMYECQEWTIIPLRLYKVDDYLLYKRPPEIIYSNKFCSYEFLIDHGNKIPPYVKQLLYDMDVPVQRKNVYKDCLNIMSNQQLEKYKYQNL